MTRGARALLLAPLVWALACGGFGDDVAPVVAPPPPPPPAPAAPPPASPGSVPVERAKVDKPPRDPEPVLAPVIVEVPPPPPPSSVPAAAADGTVEVTAAPADPAVAKVVERFTGQLRGCYTERLGTLPGLAGALSVEFDVADGRTTRAAVTRDEVGDSELAACVVRRVGRWSFPPEAAGTATATFRFTPAS